MYNAALTPVFPQVNSDSAKACSALPVSSVPRLKTELRPTVINPLTLLFVKANAALEAFPIVSLPCHTGSKTTAAPLRSALPATKLPALLPVPTLIIALLSFTVRVPALAVPVTSIVPVLTVILLASKAPVPLNLTVLSAEPTVKLSVLSSAPSFTLIVPLSALISLTLKVPASTFTLLSSLAMATAALRLPPQAVPATPRFKVPALVPSPTATATLVFAVPPDVFTKASFSLPPPTKVNSLPSPTVTLLASAAEPPRAKSLTPRFSRPLLPIVTSLVSTLPVTPACTAPVSAKSLALASV